jgi:hypothetical protein
MDICYRLLQEKAIHAKYIVKFYGMWITKHANLDAAMRAKGMGLQPAKKSADWYCLLSSRPKHLLLSVNATRTRWHSHHRFFPATWFRF